MRKWLHSLVLAALFWAAPASATWREASSKHFVIYSEQPAKSLQEFAETLELYDKGLRYLSTIADDQVSHASRVTIFILPNIGAVQRLYRAKASSSGVAGFYHDWPSGPVAFVPRSTQGDEEFGFDSRLVLQHEYAHHFMYQNFARVFPAWFSEGFAEFASTAQRKKDVMDFGIAANHRAYGLLYESSLPIEKLLEGSPAGNAQENDKFYGRSWLLCHYLTVDVARDPARAGQLGTYIKELNLGKPNLDAARTAFGDLKRLNKDLDAYLGRIQSRMMGYGIPVSRLPIGPVSIRELGPGETAIMATRIQSKAGVDKNTAPQVVALARKAAADFANDAAVQTALAEAEFDAGNYAEAEAAADRAITADPKQVDALTYKGIARMQQAIASDKHDAASWTEVRRWFLAANRLDADDPEPLTNFFYSFLRQGIEPTPNALAAGMHSLQLAPQDTGLRFILIQYFLRHDKPAEARDDLLWFASDPHRAKLRDVASAMIAALDSKGAEAALAVLKARQTAGSIEDEDSDSDREWSGSFVQQR